MNKPAVRIFIHAVCLLALFAVLIGVNVFLSIFGAKYVYKSSVLFSELFAQSSQQSIQNSARMVLGESTDIVYKDSRVASLQKFLLKHNSPLADYAQFMVETADKNGLHYGLLPAIAMVESNLCKKIIVDSYNCWGWGIYGSTVTRFASFQEGIDTVARGLKKNYVDRGLDTPEKIMQRYNPTNHNNWIGGVNFFLNILE